MGDIGIDKWCLKMEEHRRKGHNIINNYERVLLLKEKRITFWEKNHKIANFDDLINNEAVT